MEIPSESTFGLGRKNQFSHVTTSLPHYSISKCPAFFLPFQSPTVAQHGPHLNAGQRSKPTPKSLWFILAYVLTPLAEVLSAFYEMYHTTQKDCLPSKPICLQAHALLYLRCKRIKVSFNF